MSFKIKASLPPRLLNAMIAKRENESLQAAVVNTCRLLLQIRQESLLKDSGLSCLGYPSGRFCLSQLAIHSLGRILRKRFVRHYSSRVDAYGSSSRQKGFGASSRGRCFFRVCFALSKALLTIGFILAESRRIAAENPACGDGSQFLAAWYVSVISSFGRRCGTAAAEVDRMAATTSSPPVSATALIGRQSLDNAVACQHTSVDRKIPAHHERSHCRVLLGQPIGFVGEIGLVFSAVDKNQTGKTRRAPVCLVQGITPTPTSA